MWGRKSIWVVVGTMLLALCSCRSRPSIFRRRAAHTRTNNGTNNDRSLHFSSGASAIVRATLGSENAVSTLANALRWHAENTGDPHATYALSTAWWHAFQQTAPPMFAPLYSGSYEASLSPSGRFLFSRSYIAPVVGDLRTGINFPIATDVLWAFVVHHDTRLVVVKNSSLELRDLATNAMVRTVPLEQNGRGLHAVSENDELFAVAFSNGIVKTFTSEGTPRGVCNSSGDVSALVFSPDARHLAIGNSNGLIALCNVETGAIERTTDTTTIAAPVYTNRSIGAIVLENDSSFQFGWRAGGGASYGSDGALLRALGTPSSNLVAPFQPFSRNHRFASLDTDQSTVRIIDTQTASVVATVPAGPTRGYVLSPDGNFLVTIGQAAPAKLWDLRSGTPRVVSETATFYEEGAAFFDRASQMVLFGPLRNLSQRWLTIPSGVMALQSAELAEFSPDRQHVALAGSEQVHVYSLAEQRLEFSRPTQFLSAAFSPTNRSLLLSSAYGSELVSMASPNDPLREYGMSWQHSAFSPNGTQLVRATNEGSLTLRDTTTPNAAIVRGPTLERLWDLAVNNAGNRILLASDAPSIWMPGAAEPLRRLENHPGDAWSVLFSPDEAEAIYAGRDGFLRVYRSLNAEFLWQLRVTESSLQSAKFSRDGRTLMLGDDTGTIHVVSFSQRRLLRSVELSNAAIVRLGVDSTTGNLLVRDAHQTAFVLSPSLRLLARVGPVPLDVRPLFSDDAGVVQSETRLGLVGADFLDQGRTLAVVFSSGLLVKIPLENSELTRAGCALLRAQHHALPPSCS